MPDFLVLAAFVAEGLRGNPAAVVRDDAQRDDAWRQAVAAEFNLSETAFVRPQGSGWALRWWTPVAEVDLCGHATLAAAAALGHWGLAKQGMPLRFHTRSGELHCVLEGARVRLDFPALTVQSAVPPPDLLEGLGLPAGTPCFRDPEDWTVEVPSAAALRGLKPDFSRLAAVECRGVCVTAPATLGMDADFVSRFFGPRVGILEDPVTGSAHARLGPFWGGRLGKRVLVGRQLSARGGRVEVELNSIRKNRLWLSGETRLFSEGRLWS
jgi:PhzF family phenazine biosynthesis protein